MAIARAALVPIPEKVVEETVGLLNDLDGGTIIIADGMEAQDVDATREALRREGRLPKSGGEEKPPRSIR